MEQASGWTIYHPLHIPYKYSISPCHTQRVDVTRRHGCLDWDNPNSKFQPLGEDSDGKSPSFLQHLHQEGGEYFHAEQCLMIDAAKLPPLAQFSLRELKSKVWPVKISFDFMTCFSHFILIFLYCFVYLLPLPSPTVFSIRLEPSSPKGLFYCSGLTNAPWE